MTFWQDITRDPMTLLSVAFLSLAAFAGIGWFVTEAIKFFNNRRF